MAYYWAFLLLPAFFGSSSGNCGEPPRLDYGTPQNQYLGLTNFSVDANVTYDCRPGYVTVPGTSKVITCLSNSSWSTPAEFCRQRSCGSPVEIPNGQQAHITDTLFGSRVYYTCDLGYRFINKLNYSECLADGTWSNAPACEVQKCPPPFAIVDGSYEPDLDEYEYLHSVTYKCNNNSLALIGEKSISCTAYGNWSSDSTKCIVVECKSPDVENSIKLSGFTGPYNLNSAVSFQCSPGYTMTGASSVKCNVSSEWDPPLPTCSKTVTQSPTTKPKETTAGETVTQSPTTKPKETTAGGTTVSQKPSTTEKKDENNRGSTVSQKTTKQQTDKEGEGSSGAIVGNTVIIFTMAIMAFVINIGF